MATAASSVATPSTRASQPRQDNEGALVLGADYRGLGVVRSLGRRGIPVWVLKGDGQLLAVTSRYTRRSMRWPTAEERSRVDFLLDLAVKHRLKGWVLFPTTDEAVVLIARHHESLRTQFRLTVPAWEALRWACDKQLMHRLAKQLAIDQPWTFCPRDREELASLECPFPVILKPTMRLGSNAFTNAKAWQADNCRTLLARYDEACALVAPEMIMVQEVVPGGGEGQFSYAALCKDGYPIASVLARRTRQFPMDFGRASTYVETVDEPQLVEPAARVLAAIGFTGLVEIEFKRDSRDDLYKLLDINPRVWGWHTLSARAGVDFPYLIWLLLHGEPVPEVRGHPDVRWVRLSTDLPTATLEIVRGRLSLHAYLQSLGPPLQHAIFASDDPLPALLEVPLLAYLITKRMFDGRGK